VDCLQWWGMPEPDHECFDTIAVYILLAILALVAAMWIEVAIMVGDPQTFRPDAISVVAMIDCLIGWENRTKRRQADSQTRI
jgi:hypothetical protein